jgi:cellulose synthase/poly-beta-1,6-N-acetylglucosamine synthase-like glycosyltransferase
MTYPEISVIVSCYDKSDMIRNCVESLIKQDMSSFEVIVVDDGSTDGSLQILEALRSYSVLRIVTQDHRGISATKNRGIAASRGSILLFLDGDCVLEQGSLTELAKSFRDNVIGCVGGEVRAINSSSLIAKAVEYMQNEVERKWPFGANVAYRRSVLDTAGFFDERMVAGEDAELYLRTIKLGFKSKIERNIVARTKNPDNPVSFFRQRLKWGRGFCQLTERHPEAFTGKIKACFLWIAAMLLSPLLTLVDTNLIWVAPALVIYNVVRFVPGTMAIYRSTRDAKRSMIIPFLRFLNALAYVVGWCHWRVLELMHKSERLEPFVPKCTDVESSSLVELPT